VETFREGLYFDDVLSTPMSELAGRLEENARSGLTLKEALIKSIKETTKGVQRMSLRKGKKSRDDAGISKDNILDKRRNEKRVSSFVTPLPRTKDEYEERNEEFKNHPVWDLLPPTEYYDVTKHWDWTPETGHTPTAEMRAKEWDNPANVEEEPETTFGFINREIRRRHAESLPKVSSKSGKIPENYLDSRVSQKDTTFYEDETILLQDKAGHFPKGKDGSGKRRQKFSGSQNRQGSSSAKGQRKRAKALLGKHKAWRPYFCSFGAL
jgi:hypothetical protein